MGGLLKTPTPPKPAPPPETPTAPDADDAAVRRAERRSRAATRARSGVLSTVRPSAGGSLGATPGGDTVLGGSFDRFSNQTLGGR